jgi:hypothetical protein
MAVNQLGDGSADGVQLPNTKVGFYGATPVAIRASTASFHQSSWVSASSNITVGTALAAWAAEVTATLQGLGIWV